MINSDIHVSTFRTGELFALSQRYFLNVSIPSFSVINSDIHVSTLTTGELFALSQTPFLLNTLCLNIKSSENYKSLRFFFLCVMSSLHFQIKLHTGNIYPPPPLVVIAHFVLVSTVEND